ncbi:MAG: flagellar motor switch protein FliN [Gammaproteobacteria bacterium]|jgi:flagellar motor switch protein FliN/FliY
MSDTEQAAPESGAVEKGAEAKAAEEFAAAEFDNLEADTPGKEQAHRLDLILDVPVNLSLEVGRTSMSVGDLLQLSQGSVVELDRLAGEPLDVLVNGTLVAHGEIVVVNDKFGIRLTDVVSPAERVRKLR